jgi:hypothetical protein
VVRICAQMGTWKQAAFTLPNGRRSSRGSRSSTSPFPATRLPGLRSLLWTGPSAQKRGRRQQSSLMAMCYGLQWKNARLAIEPLSGPTIIDSGARVRPTCSAPEPALVSRRLTIIETNREHGAPAHRARALLTHPPRSTTVAAKHPHTGRSFRVRYGSGPLIRCGGVSPTPTWRIMVWPKALGS